jgi:hypothetical protein
VRRLARITCSATGDDVSRAPGGGRSRLWLIPPAILRDADETLEGLHVLRENDGPRGLRLWVALRDVTLWAGTQPEARGSLFGPGAAARRLDAIAEASLEPGLEVPLVTLAALVNDPRGVQPRAVTLACRRIAAWAEERVAPGTAVAFAQAAALASPHDAQAALQVGRLALAAGGAARADTWLRRTVAVARRAQDLNAYGSAYAALGALFAERGAVVAARRHYVKALRAARRGGHLHVRVTALHGLFRLTVAAGHGDEAERLSRPLLRAARRMGVRAPALLLDMAAMHLSRRQPQRAEVVLRKLLRDPVAAAERVAALSMLAIAAAARDDAAAYEEAWRAAWVHAADAPARDAGALLNLARAAAERGDWLWVDQALSRSSEHLRRPADRRDAEALARALADARNTPRAGRCAERPCAPRESG